jgi:hypothetical protein
MKSLKDYKGEEAIELWADLAEPIAKIMADEEVKNSYGEGKPIITMVKTILKRHKEEAEEILLRIDDTPINALNLVTRTLSVALEVINDESVASFLLQDSEEVATTSGNVMAITTESVN